MRKRNFFKAAHRDKAERPIIQALRSVGASVYAVSGKDIPDLLVGFQGVTTLLEVKSRLVHEGKDGYTRKTSTRVSKGQTEFAEKWRGGPARFVYEPAEALRAIGAPYQQTPQTGLRWLAENGAFLCEGCWLPENGLHAKDCPTRKALARSPKVASAYRAAKTLEEAMPKARTPDEEEVKRRHTKGPSRVASPAEHHGVNQDVLMAVAGDERPSRGVEDIPEEVRIMGRATTLPRGVEGELQPLKAKR